MSSYIHFTLPERKYLQELLSSGYSMRKAASALGRSPSSVSREIRRNRSVYPPKHPSDNPYQYHHWRAQTLSITRRRNISPRSLCCGTPEWNFVFKGLLDFWSPEQIVFRWRMEHPNGSRFGVSTVYRNLARGSFPLISRKTHLRRRGKRRVTRSACYNTIQPDRLIPQWPEEISSRSRLGDWEGDTVYGATGKGLLVTMVDRRSRFLCAALLPSRESGVTRDTICSMMTGFPVKSISLDNGSEFSEFRALETALDTEVYFAEPHKPWQRGTNENTNDLLRFFFPKGYNFHSLTPEALKTVVDLINNRPRKCLAFRSPAEVFAGVALA